MNEPNEPLDFPDRPQSNKDRYFALRAVGTGLLIVGLLFRFMHWPYGYQILLAGLIVWSFWNLLFMFTPPRRKGFEYAYSVGRLSLAAALFAQIFLDSASGLYFFGLAATSFVVGVVLALQSDQKP